MSRLALVGYGRMGRLVEQLAPEHGFEVALRLHGAEGGARIDPEITPENFQGIDVAIDFCEDVPRLSAESVAQIVALMRAEGLTAKVSSIHVNGWFGSYDKLTMTRRLLADEFAIELDQTREQFIFVGDSPNDASMFQFFPYSVGVANVREFGDGGAVGDGVERSGHVDARRGRDGDAGVRDGAEA